MSEQLAGDRLDQVPWAERVAMRHLLKYHADVAMQMRRDLVSGDLSLAGLVQELDVRIGDLEGLRARLQRWQPRPAVP